MRWPQAAFIAMVFVNAFRRLRLFLILCMLGSGVPLLAMAESPSEDKDRAFLTQASCDNAMVVAMAQLALQKSSDAQIKTYAQRVINERNGLNGKLSPFLAGDASLRNAPARYAAMAQDHLKNLQGQDFDKTFLSLMLREQQNVIPSYQVAAQTASQDGLRDFARDNLPVLQAQLDAAQSLLPDEAGDRKLAAQKARSMPMVVGHVVAW